MAIVGYARVSTKQQSLEIQLEKLKAHGCSRIYEEKLSGIDQNRPELIKCKEYLREGDTLVITKLDRMARSAVDLGNIIKRFEKEGINLVVLDQNIDTTTSYGKLTFHILGAVAEFENEIRKERQSEGIAKAKAKGKAFGRPPKLDKDKTINLLNDILAKKYSVTEIEKKYDISRKSYYNIKNKYQVVLDTCLKKDLRQVDLSLINQDSFEFQ